MGAAKMRVVRLLATFAADNEGGVDGVQGLAPKKENPAQSLATERGCGV